MTEEEMEALLLIHVQIGARVRMASSKIDIRGEVIGFVPDVCCGFMPAVICEDDGEIKLVCQRWLVPDKPGH